MSINYDNRRRVRYHKHDTNHISINNTTENATISTVSTTLKKADRSTTILPDPPMTTVPMAFSIG